MKKLIISVFIFLLCQIEVLPQDADKTVTLVVTSQGKTIDEAKSNALRSAIEKAFGAFISSNTTILNDNVLKDEIVSIANGNIKSYEKISEIKTNDQNISLTLSVVVTLNKLTDFIKSKGFAADFNGDLFATNVLIKNFNKENEVKVMYENTKIAKQLITNIFDYRIKYVPPKMLENNLWGIDLDIEVFSNENSKIFFDWLHYIIKSISLTKREILEYENLKIKFFKVHFGYGPTLDGGEYYFRDESSIYYLNEVYKKMIVALGSYELVNSPELKYGKLLKEDPEITFKKCIYLSFSDRYGGYLFDKKFSMLPKEMKVYSDGSYVFNIVKKGVKVISFKNVDVLTIEDIKKITEYKINPKKY